MMATKSRAMGVSKPFLYATSVFVENLDSIVIGAGLNDNGCLLFRMKGIKKLLSKPKRPR